MPYQKKIIMTHPYIVSILFGSPLALASLCVRYGTTKYYLFCTNAWLGNLAHATKGKNYDPCRIKKKIVMTHPYIVIILLLLVYSSLV